MITDQEIEDYIVKHTNEMIDAVPVDKVRLLVRLMKKKDSMFNDENPSKFTWSRMLAKYSQYNVGDKIVSRQIILDMNMSKYNSSTYRTYRCTLVRKGFIQLDGKYTVILKKITFDIGSQAYYKKENIYPVIDGDNY